MTAVDETGGWPTDDRGRLTLTVRRRADESDGVVSLELVDAGGLPLPFWTPGSHIDFHVTDTIVRHYSLCSNPEDLSFWRVGILNARDGRGGSTLIHDTVKPGDVIAVSLPRNNFALAPSPRYVFVAGGIGITPIIPMIRQAEQAGADWSLVYGGRTAASMAFAREVAEYGDRVRLVPEDTHGRVDFAGLFAEPESDTLIYCCGPERMLEVVQAATEHWPAGALHTERFVASAVDTAGDVAFEVEFADSGLTATIPADRSILEVAEELGLNVISSCREGTCGTCETVVIDGIPEHRDSILTAAERADNETMFICVGRSVGGCRLTLEI
ncbi:PDR/VanB family oxidoreductase [Subtercola endophyticus]|uniref:PDR/VanB family oxidoreductase n=1 Tax=Subtercola endophyticus TaxID=2895559 RepID=UPI001E3F9F59|nr:PDR/VanB family oxidoreductase [Subtercola endophyticus]UFS58095.1 PDR/VanB family oxidoreductase [Subtercola endophyticus]